MHKSLDTLSPHREETIPTGANVITSYREDKKKRQKLVEGSTRYYHPIDGGTKSTHEGCI